MTNEIKQHLKSYGMDDYRIRLFDNAGKECSSIGSFISFVSNEVDLGIACQLNELLKTCNPEFRKMVVDHYSL